MDWVNIAWASALIVVGVAIVVVVVRAGTSLARRPAKPSRVGKAKGEFQPPEPPEGRYWG